MSEDKKWKLTAAPTLNLTRKESYFNPDVPSRPLINLEIVSYVRLDSLTTELQEKIRNQVFNLKEENND